jgi:hypothetical protein
MKNVLVTRWDVPAEKWLVVSQAGGAPLP